MWNWAEWTADLAVRLAGLDAARGAGAALHFFVYDLQKIVVLILVVAFVMALVRGALPLERIRGWLERPGGRVLGYPAALLTLSALGLASAAPSTPGFVGIYQFVAVSVLPGFGLSRAEALAFILALQGTIYLYILPWGLIGLWRLNRGRAPAP